MNQKDSTVFSGTLFTSYCQMFVVSGDRTAELLPGPAFAGHRNGLLGGAVASGLFLCVGVHTGEVHITVKCFSSKPPIDESWEEIVEASCTFRDAPISLEGWGSLINVDLPLVAGDYRARLSANGYGLSEGLRVFGDPSVEQYELSIWPAVLGIDEVVKQTRALAGHRHGRVASEGR